MPVILGDQAAPSGIVNMYAGTTAPIGWLLCDGSAVSRTQYSGLFYVIGTTYGAGDGSTTFNLPNFKGRTPAGKDSTQTEFNALGKTGGEKSHILIVSELPSHSHDFAYNNYNGAGTASYSAGTAGYGSQTTASALGIPQVKNTGSDQAHNNLQPYLTMNFIIKT